MKKWLQKEGIFFSSDMPKYIFNELIKGMSLRNAVYSVDNILQSSGLHISASHLIRSSMVYCEIMGRFPKYSL